MAAKFIVAVALIALCSANPALINGEVYRDGRAFSRGEAYNYGGGLSQAQANVIGGTAQALSRSSNDGPQARNGYYYPGGAAVAQAQANQALESPAYGTAKAVAQNGGYYQVPEPATVITYEQRFAAPSDASVAAFSKDGGAAESTAKAQPGYGSFGLTSSKANSFGSGSAGSTARTGSSVTTANTQGSGFAQSSTQDNGVVDVVYNVVPVEPTQQQPAIIAAKTPVFYTTYEPIAPAQEVASANAKSYGHGNAASSAKITHGRTISWRFGTLYDSPAAARTVANTQSGFGAVRSNAYTQGNGYANSLANTAGSALSSATSNGVGSANANADVNGAGYGNARNAYYGASRGSTNAQTQGDASSFARTQGGNIADSRAASHGSGSARANAQYV